VASLTQPLTHSKQLLKYTRVRPAHWHWHAISDCGGRSQSQKPQRGDNDLNESFLHVFFSLGGLNVFEQSELHGRSSEGEHYRVGQRSGQHIGAGVPSAIAEVVPKARSSSVVTTILRRVFFMCFLLSRLVV